MENNEEGGSGGWIALGFVVLVIVGLTVTSFPFKTFEPSAIFTEQNEEIKKQQTLEAECSEAFKQDYKQEISDYSVISCAVPTFRQTFNPVDGSYTHTCYCKALGWDAEKRNHSVQKKNKEPFKASFDLASSTVPLPL